MPPLVRSWLPILVVLLAGVPVGVLIGIAIGARSGATTLAAEVGIVVVIVGAVLAWGLGELTAQRRSRADQEVRDREHHREKVLSDTAEYRRHADELNDHVFTACGTAVLTPNHTPYPNDISPSRGLQVIYQGKPVPISNLPNWGFGLSHLLAEATVRDAWNEAITANTNFQTAFDRAMDLLLARLDAEITRAYGGGMYLRRSQNDADRLTWCETPSLAFVLYCQRADGVVRKFLRPQSAEEQRGLPRLPSSGGMVMSRGGVFLQGLTAADSDPAPLQHIYDAALADPTIQKVLDSAIAAEQEAKTRIAKFAEVTLLYSNEIRTSHTFAGRCKVCENYVLA
jgi:hypothetical protein